MYCSHVKFCFKEPFLQQKTFLFAGKTLWDKCCSFCMNHKQLMGNDHHFEARLTYNNERSVSVKK